VATGACFKVTNLRQLFVFSLSMSSPDTSSSTSSRYAFPHAQASYTTIRPQHHAEPRSPSPLADRLHSIDELAAIVSLAPYDPDGNIKKDFRLVEMYLAQGKNDLEAGDLQWAFVHFARTATLILVEMPKKDDYYELGEIHRRILDNVSTSYRSQAVDLALVRILFLCSDEEWQPLLGEDERDKTRLG
jgi:hypothetical protein